ncbi:cytochrome o ubiquinol oxidase subunit IV [Daeguia caeni]|uniref:Cytochrome bo(3) ubiquinol oxidase subunit 4 n=1 Tax=Daeguia caeni TaxID=439612 RepID=A0ABV9HA92_9HYPH
MSAAHDTHHENHDHGSLKSYVTGFILAVILTVVPFALAMGGYFTPPQTALIVLVLAAVQIVVHLVYFLHMSPKSEGGWNMLALVFTAVILVIVLTGSIWIMYHLDINMMPVDMGPEAVKNLP